MGDTQKWDNGWFFSDWCLRSQSIQLLFFFFFASWTCGLIHARVVKGHALWEHVGQVRMKATVVGKHLKIIVGGYNSQLRTYRHRGSPRTKRATCSGSVSDTIQGDTSPWFLYSVDIKLKVERACVGSKLRTDRRWGSPRAKRTTPFVSLSSSAVELDNDTIQYQGGPAGFNL